MLKRTFFSLQNFILNVVWLFNPYRLINTYKIIKLKDKYKNEKAVIICNGPSLLNHNLNELDGLFTIGLNKINLLFDKSNFRPNLIVAVNSHVIEQNSFFYKNSTIPIFLNSKSFFKFGFKKNINYLFTTDCLFSKNVALEVSEGYTVTYVALQLAYYLGFKYVTLIGCDHNFGNISIPNKSEVRNSEDAHHFDPNYFGIGMKWHTADIFESEISYRRAKHYYENNKMKIFNSTIGGNLDIFEKISISNFKLI